MNVNSYVLNVLDLILELVSNEVEVVDVDDAAEAVEQVGYIENSRTACGLSGLLSLFAFLSSLSCINSLGLLVCIEVNINLLDVVPVFDDIVCEDIDLVSVDEAADLIEEISYIENDGLSRLLAVSLGSSRSLRLLSILLGSYRRCRGLRLFAVFLNLGSSRLFSSLCYFLSSLCCFLSCNCYSCLFCFLVCSKCVKSCYR